MWEWPLGVHVGVVPRGACGRGLSTRHKKGNAKR